jgi:hypothetical protein
VGSQIYLTLKRARHPIEFRFDTAQPGGDAFQRTRLPLQKGSDISML